MDSIDTNLVCNPEYRQIMEARAKARAEFLDGPRRLIKRIVEADDPDESFDRMMAEDPALKETLRALAPFFDQVMPGE